MNTTYMFVVAGTEAHEVGVVDNVVMGQSGALRLPRGPTGVLDVGRIVGLYVFLKLRQFSSIFFRANFKHVIVGPCAA